MIGSFFQASKLKLMEFFLRRHHMDTCQYSIVFVCPRPRGTSSRRIFWKRFIIFNSFLCWQFPHYCRLYLFISSIIWAGKRTSSTIYSLALKKPRVNLQCVQSKRWNNIAKRALSNHLTNQPTMLVKVVLIPF